MKNCIFCKIVRGEAPCHKIWEDEKHLAFLSIYPNTLGASVVITKKHYPSYAFDLPDEVLTDLVIATKKVAKLLDSKLDDVGRTGVVFEGFAVDHVHTKLFPMHGTKMKQWNPILSKIDTYMGIKVEFNPDLALRNISEYKKRNRKKDECIPANLKAGKIYRFLKEGQRNYWLEGELPLLETKGNQKLSRPIASIIILEASHFLLNKKPFTRGEYKVIEIFDLKDTKIHFEGYTKVD